MTFYFYDLETSGIFPKEARIMQFAGQRTDMQLKPLGEPHNFLIKLSEDVLPDPDAVLVTGITPQQTLQDGLNEAEFLKIFHEEIASPDTIFAGYNTVRFDDEFMRYLHYRNFYDPYEWQWQNRKSRWDLLDVARMTRALRPEGIKWPRDDEGNPTNRLELIAQANGLAHDAAHDALSDVKATIELAELIKSNQPKLFDFLLQLRTKKAVHDFIKKGEPFVYSSGKYDSEFEKTTIVGVVAAHPTSNAYIVFDLRYDPEKYSEYDAKKIAESLTKKKDDAGQRVPAKVLKPNRCPAIAPLGVLDESSQERLRLDPKIYLENYKKLRKLRTDLGEKISEALKILDAKREQTYANEQNDADNRLYDGFFNENDKTKMSAVRASDVSELANFNTDFDDERLSALLPLYKARNYPKSLTEEDRVLWDEFKKRKLLGGKEESRMVKFFKRLSELDAASDISARDRFLLEELQLYGQSIIPYTEEF